MKPFLPFDQFWELANRQSKQHNAPVYHACCDTWSTRGKKTIRSTHTKSLRWSQLMKSLNCTTEERKQALLAKLSFEQRRINIALNQRCSENLKIQTEAPCSIQDTIENNVSNHLNDNECHYQSFPHEPTEVEIAEKGTEHLIQSCR
jgi:hypothetical protein